MTNFSKKASSSLAEKRQREAEDLGHDQCWCLGTVSVLSLGSGFSYK